jgi:hypothetical protein
MDMQFSAQITAERLRQVFEVRIAVISRIYFSDISNLCGGLKSRAAPAGKRDCIVT